jgi:N6-L-threonylcarbamoyladenine synthase
MVATLTEKVDRAVRLYRRTTVVLGGGVACNAALQSGIAERMTTRGARVFAPSARLATDNAAMIAAAGLYRFAAGERMPAALTAQSSLPLPGMFLFDVAAPR